MRHARTLEWAGCAAAAVLLGLAAAACGADEEPPPSAAGAAAAREVAERLVQRLERDPDSGHVAVEIDSALLAELSLAPNPAASGLTDPLAAARLYAAAIDLPEDAAFVLEDPPLEIGEASGLFTATVRVGAGPRIVRMRLVSDPDEHDRPTLWVLNDFREEGEAAAGP